MIAALDRFDSGWKAEDASISPWSNSARTVAGERAPSGAPPDAVIVDATLAPPPPGLHLSPTIFHEAWWLDIACDGNGGEVTASTGGRLVARLPYLVSRRLPGLTTLGMPLMAHVLGPAILAPAAPDGFPNAMRQIAITRELIAQLPSAAHVSFRLHGGITNTLAFDAAGFSSSVAYTVEIAPAPADVLWRQMRDKTRNVIRRAQEILRVSELEDPVAFMDFYEANMHARGLRCHYDRHVAVRLIDACLARRVGRLLVARDAAGRPQAAVLTVRDRASEYYFMSTRTQDSHNGATSLVIWTAIQHAASLGLVFDMDGLHVANNRMPNLWLFVGFGGVIRPRYVVRRASALGDAARAVRDLVRGRKGSVLF